MTKQSKDTLTVWSAIVMLAFGVALTATAFCIDPVGEIPNAPPAYIKHCPSVQSTLS